MTARYATVLNMDNTIPLSIHDRGRGRTLLLLHGGTGPKSVIPFADRLVETGGIRAIVPTHPGFSGTERPATLRTPADLADRYAALLRAYLNKGMTPICCQVIRVKRNFSSARWFSGFLDQRMSSAR